ncbi:hypothetical protein [Jannaschia sp. M317]|uniref:hypothetical protein n=1 Tax=Jannaschia sp. M317 TaxID=2867011 RepID=UPI0021A8D350|nr:hypothetical protein [Jannaschia sp. M317]UWQ18057.1 hypothetical protein K3551_01755 [Jannaschia sp. M317]
MSIEILLIGLVALSFAAAIIFALTSRRATRDRKADPKAPKSSLAKDGDPHDRAD